VTMAFKCKKMRGQQVRDWSSDWDRCSDTNTGATRTNSGSREPFLASQRNIIIVQSLHALDFYIRETRQSKKKSQERTKLSPLCNVPLIAAELKLSVFPTDSDASFWFC
jgi:hypothetical protein